MGLPSSPYPDSTRFEAYVVNAILGGGMTSKLYQIIREERGLAYSVYSYLHSFTDAGLIMVYAGTSEKNALPVMELIRGEMLWLKDRGVSEEDLGFFQKAGEGTDCSRCR